MISLMLLAALAAAPQPVPVPAARPPVEAMMKSMDKGQAALTKLIGTATIDLEAHGTLREVLREVAHKGNLNLVASGELDEPAELILKGVSPEEALTSIAKAYDLQVKHEGNLWVVKPAAAGAALAVPPLPPVPPGAEAVPLVGAEAEAEAARERAEALREEAEALREQADELRDAKREERDAAREHARAKVDEAKALRISGPEAVSMNGPVTIPANTRVDSAISYGGMVTIEENAVVEGDVVSFGGDVLLKKNARVEGDAVSFGGKVVKEAGAKVGGEEVSFGAGKLSAAVASKAFKASRPTHDEAGNRNERSAVAAFFAQFAVLFGLGFLLMMFAPSRMKTIEAEMQAAPVKNGFAGLLAMICAVPMSVFLVITLIGIPVVVAFWLLASVAAVMGVVAIANQLGARVPVPRMRRTQAIALAVGLLVTLLVARIPVAGPLLFSMAMMVSFGAIIRTRMGQRGQGLPIASPGFIDSQPVR